MRRKGLITFDEAGEGRGKPSLRSLIDPPKRTRKAGMAAPLFALAQPYRPRSPRPKLHHATSFILLSSDGGDGSGKVLLHEGFVEPRHIVAAGWQLGIPGRQNEL